MLYWSMLIYDYEEVGNCTAGVPTCPDPQATGPTPLPTLTLTYIWHCVCPWLFFIGMTPCHCSCPFVHTNAFRAPLTPAVLQVEKSDYDLETAMGLYGLTDFELMWERTMDTKYDSPSSAFNFI